MYLLKTNRMHKTFSSHSKQMLSIDVESKLNKLIASTQLIRSTQRPRSAHSINSQTQHNTSIPFSIKKKYPVCSSTRRDVRRRTLFAVWYLVSMPHTIVSHIPRRTPSEICLLEAESRHGWGRWVFGAKSWCEVADRLNVKGVELGWFCGGTQRGMYDKL